MKGASEAAMEQGTSAGSSSRTGVKRKVGGNKDAQQTKSEGMELGEPGEGRANEGWERDGMRRGNMTQA